MHIKLQIIVGLLVLLPHTAIATDCVQAYKQELAKNNSIEGEARAEIVRNFCYAKLGKFNPLNPSGIDFVFNTNVSCQDKIAHLEKAIALINAAPISENDKWATIESIKTDFAMMENFGCVRKDIASTNSPPAKRVEEAQKKPPKEKEYIEISAVEDSAEKTILKNGESQSLEDLREQYLEGSQKSREEMKAVIDRMKLDSKEIAQKASEIPFREQGYSLSEQLLSENTNERIIYKRSSWLETIFPKKGSGRSKDDPLVMHANTVLGGYNKYDGSYHTVEGTLNTLEIKDKLSDMAGKFYKSLPYIEKNGDIKKMAGTAIKDGTLGIVEKGVASSLKSLYGATKDDRLLYFAKQAAREKRLQNNMFFTFGNGEILEYHKEEINGIIQDKVVFAK